MKYLKLLLVLSFIVFIMGCGSTTDNEVLEHQIIKVACIGDSITEGTGLHNPANESYPSQLKNILGKGWDVQNFGKKSATLMKSGSSPYWNTSMFESSHNYSPDIVVIMLGTNDAKPGNWVNNSYFVADYTELIESYKNLPTQPRIYICYPPPVYGNVAGITNTRIINEVIPKIFQTASNNGLEIIDIYSALSNNKSLFPDKVHPNAEGAKIMAESIYQIIY